MASSSKFSGRYANLEGELEALRHELRQVPRMAEEAEAVAANAATAAASQTGEARSEVERVLGELQARFADAADEAENIIAANPFASVAAAFLLGVLVANVMSRGK